MIQLHKNALDSAGAPSHCEEYDKDLYNIEKVYFKNGGEFLVGLENGRIITMGAFQKTSDTSAEIKRMRTEPEHQRKGYGQLILNELEKKAKEAGFKLLHLDTAEQLTGAQAFYLKNGYKEVSRKIIDSFMCIFFEKHI